MKTFIYQYLCGFYTNPHTRAPYWLFTDFELLVVEQLEQVDESWVS